MNTGTTYKLFKRTKIFFAALFVFLMGEVGSVSGATKTWDGSSSNDWNTAANWTPSGVPTSSDDVIIPDNFNVTVNTAAVCASFTINEGNNDNQITISDGQSLTVSGGVTINKGKGYGDNKYISVGSGTLTAGSITMANTGNNNRDSYISVLTGTINVSRQYYNEWNCRQKPNSFLGGRYFECWWNGNNFRRDNIKRCRRIYCFDKWNSEL